MAHKLITEVKLKFRRAEEKEQYEISIRNAPSDLQARIRIIEEQQKIRGQYGSRVLYDRPEEAKIDQIRREPDYFNATCKYTIYLKPEEKDFSDKKEPQIGKKFDV